MQAPLLHWSEPITQLAGFAASFLATGAVGFRYAAVRDRLTNPARPLEELRIYGDAAQRAAEIGLLGALVQGAMLVMRLPDAASRAHVSVGELLTTDRYTIGSCVLLAAAIVGLSLAALGRRKGWPIAATGIVCGALVEIGSGQWSRLINPIHELLAGLWLGTLFVLMVVGITSVFNDESSRGRRGAIVADMVNNFSPVALTCGGLLVISGLLNAWQHLNPLSSLWTTPYGYVLLVKLGLVAFVFGLGAWNWRRMRPRMGTESGAVAIRRSSLMELGAATLVLVATAVLVSLPSPRPAPAPAGEVRDSARSS